DDSSWHYTIGNDGIYQQMADTDSAWHCGDGASNEMCDIDTGVKAPANASEKPEITISSDGYFVIDGTKSTYAAPLIDGEIATTADIAPLGMLTIIGDNGNYFMHAYYNSSYDTIASYGGLNTIGIETAVNYGSDIFLTWQRLAKFVAAKEIQYDLSYERVCYHNNLSGKTCPNSMMHADMIDYFEEMVEVEWTIAHDYSNYTIAFTSSNPEVLDNSGRVVGDGPEMTTSVPYTVTVTNTITGVSESMTLNTVVIGQHSQPAMEMEPSVNPYTGISE
ncbi:MAG: N-acetylmuramoyl-L-alanine amidase, partial [Bacilli bacterium]